jgi:hypothetical protein
MLLKTSVVEPGRYRRILRSLVGLDVQDNQARRLLNDIHNFGAWLQQEAGRSLPESVIAHRWLERSFEPTVDAVPAELRSRRDDAEIFHEVLEHWHRWSAEEGADLDLSDAADRYVREVLTVLPEERLVPPSEGADRDADLDDYVPDPLATTGEIEPVDVADDPVDDEA